MLSGSHHFEKGRALVVALAIIFMLEAGAGAEATSDTLTTAAPTRETYREAVARHALKNPNGRWEKMVRTVLEAPNPPQDGKYVSIGRGEVEQVLPLAVAGRYFAEKGDAANGKKFTDGALKTLRVCCRVAVDHYYANDEEGEGGNRGQISFVLPEVARACVILKESGALAGEEWTRTRQMLEIIADHRMKIMPDIGAGGMSNWINRAGLGVLRVANYLEDEWKADAAFAKARPDLPVKIAAMRRFALLPLRCGMDYPYQFRNQPDGKCSPAFYYEGRGKDRVERPAPADRHPRFGVTEDSNGYAADSVGNLLCMIAETPRAALPELTDKRMKELCAWMLGWQATVMPIGTVPCYGDGGWGSSMEWLTAFEQAAAMFKDAGAYGGAAAGFRATAARIFRYGQTIGGGNFNAGLTRAALAADDSIQPVEEPQKPTVVMQQSPQGKLQPGKIVLRGDAEQMEKQPFAMFGTFYNSSHSHGDIGCLIAYGAEGSVFQHEEGYDAGDMFFHQLFLVRPAGEPFLPFAKVFQNPKETLLKKGAKGLSNNWRTLISAEVNDFRMFAHARIVTNSNAQLTKVRTDFLLTRDAVLEKKSGALIVCDAITGKTDLREPISCSPLWHVQNILAKTSGGFLCQDDYQAKHEPNTKEPKVIASPVRPVWIGMAGPAGFTPESLEWHFICRNGHADIPQRQHLFLSGSTSLKKDETLLTVTVFVPMPEGTKAISTPPAKIVLNGGNALVTFGDLTYQFGKMPGEANALLKAAGKDAQGKPYDALLLREAGNNRQVER